MTCCYYDAARKHMKLWLCRTSQVLSCTVTAGTGAVHIASSAADSSIQDRHAAANFGFCGSEPKKAPSMSTAGNALWILIQDVMTLKEPKEATAYTIGCIDTASRHLTGQLCLKPS